MKVFLLLVFHVLFSLVVLGQNRVYDAKELTTQAYTMQDLDSIYKNGLPANDTINPVFNKIYFDSIVAKERIQLLNDMANYFIKQGFKWEPSITIWTRIYCDTNGTVDYLFYHFMKPISSIKEKEFRLLSNNYVRDNKLSITASRKFSICGSMTWYDN